MKEASHSVFRVGVGINPRPGCADSGSSNHQMNQKWRWDSFSIMVLWEITWSISTTFGCRVSCGCFDFWTVMLTIIDVGNFLSEVSACRKFLRLILSDLFPASPWSCRICFQHVFVDAAHFAQTFCARWRAYSRSQTFRLQNTNNIRNKTVVRYECCCKIESWLTKSVQDP